MFRYHDTVKNYHATTDRYGVYGGAGDYEGKLQAYLESITNTPMTPQEPLEPPQAPYPTYDPCADLLDPYSAPTTASGEQIGGDHYCKLPIQPFEYTMANRLDPMQHTIIKYVTRFRDKNGIQDLKKARHTIDLLIQWEESGQYQAKL